VTGETRPEVSIDARDSRPSEWSRDLVESDRRYFEAGAEILRIPGAVIAVLRDAGPLAAACVVQRIDTRAIAADADDWLADVEGRLRALSSPRARLYLENTDPALAQALLRRGYRPRVEHGFARAAEARGASDVELVPAEDGRSWTERHRIMGQQDLAVDGHAMDADLWIALERRKCESGYMRPYLILSRGEIVGAVCAAPSGCLLRMKNLVVDAGQRRRGFATAAAVSFARLARDAGLEATGCFALAGEPGLLVYPRAGYRESVVQTEWVRNLA
jgi:hypothetical protein